MFFEINNNHLSVFTYGWMRFMAETNKRQYISHVKAPFNGLISVCFVFARASLAAINSARLLRSNRQIYVQNKRTEIKMILKFHEMNGNEGNFVEKMKT